MKTVYNKPTVQFLVEVIHPESKLVVDRFTIEQNEGPKRDTNRERNMYNTVRGHLNALSVRNHFDYKIVMWGDVKDRSAWLAGGKLDD